MEFYKEAGLASFYGCRKLDRKVAVTYDTFGTSDVGRLEPISLDVTASMRDQSERDGRVDKDEYDMSYELTQVFKGTVLRTMSVGRNWSWLNGTICTRNGADWGMLQKALAPAFSGLSIAVPEQGSFSSWNSLQTQLGSQNVIMPGALTGQVRALDKTDINAVRFIWRLAVLYLTAKKAEMGGRQAYLTRNTAPPAHVVDSVQAFANAVDNAATGTNYVPYVVRSWNVLTDSTLRVLYTAASSGIKIDGKAPICWPEINNVVLLITGTQNMPTALTDLSSADIYRCAVAWCHEFADTGLFHEAIENIVALSTSPIKSTVLGTKMLSIGLPMAKMQAYALAPIMLPQEVSADFGEPKMSTILEQGVIRAGMLSLAFWNWAFYGIVWLGSRKFMPDGDQDALYMNITTVHQYPPLWNTLQHYIEAFGYKGKLGRIIASAATTVDRSRAARIWRNKQANWPQWEELAANAEKLPINAGLWSRLYPLMLDANYKLGSWATVGSVVGARTVAECMGSVAMAGTNYKLRVHAADGSVATYPTGPSQNYNGEIADHSFFVTTDAYHRRYEPIFQVTAADSYYMMSCKDSVRFEGEWFIEKSAVGARLPNLVPYNATVPPGIVPPPESDSGSEHSDSANGDISDEDDDGSSADSREDNDDKSSRQEATGGDDDNNGRGHDDGGKTQARKMSYKEAAMQPERPQVPLPKSASGGRNIRENVPKSALPGETGAQTRKQAAVALLDEDKRFQQSPYYKAFSQLTRDIDNPPQWLFGAKTLLRDNPTGVASRIHPDVMDTDWFELAKGVSMARRASWFADAADVLRGIRSRCHSARAGVELSQQIVALQTASRAMYSGRSALTVDELSHALNMQIPKPRKLTKKYEQDRDYAEEYDRSVKQWQYEESQRKKKIDKLKELRVDNKTAFAWLSAGKSVDELLNMPRREVLSMRGVRAGLQDKIEKEAAGVKETWNMDSDELQNELVALLGLTTDEAMAIAAAELGDGGTPMIIAKNEPGVSGSQASAAPAQHSPANAETEQAKKDLNDGKQSTTQSQEAALSSLERPLAESWETPVEAAFTDPERGNTGLAHSTN